jgi:hypothetical protein
MVPTLAFQRLTNVADGSTASVERSRHVGFTPDSGRMATTQLNDASGHFRKSPNVQQVHAVSSLSNALASFRSSVSKPCCED